MAFTREQLQAVEAAIVALSTGERVVEVRFGANEVTRYATAELPQLISLRDRMKAEIQASENNGRRLRGYRLNHRRGL